MTVSSTAAFSGPFSGNGQTAAFPFDFKSMGPSEVSVWVNGLEISDFSVVLEGDGGTVTFANPPAEGAEILIVSKPSFLQDIDFKNNGAFLPETHDEANDRAAVRDIIMQAKINALISAPMLPASRRKGKFLAWDASGNPAASAGTGSDIGLRDDLSQDGGAALIGTSDGSNVQADLDARPTSQILAASGGAALIGFLQSGTGAVSRTQQDKNRDILSVKDWGAVGNGTANDRAAIQAALDQQDTSVIGSFQMTVPDGRYALDGSGGRLLQIQNGTSLLGSSLEGTVLIPEASSTALTVVEDNGNGAKIEIRNVTVPCGDNANLTAIFQLGIRDVQFGTWGTLDNVTARDAPNAVGFNLDVNILQAGSLQTMFTRDGLVTADGGSGFQIKTFYPFGWSRHGLKFGGIGDCVLQSEFEAPTSDDAICIYGSRDFVAGMGTTIVAPGANRVVKTMFQYDPIFVTGAAIGPFRFIRTNTTTRFGDSANPADSGTATGVGANTLTDTSKSWARDQWKGAAIFITSGTGNGNWAQVASNTADTITLASTIWPATAPIIGSGYALDYAIKAVGGGGHRMGRSLTLPDAAILQLSTEKHVTDRSTVGSRGSEKRQEIFFSATLDFASVNANSVGTALSISVPGVTTTGKWVVTITLPDAAAAQGVVYTPTISASDTVKVYPKNLTGSPIDPASMTIRGTAVEYA